MLKYSSTLKQLYSEPNMIFIAVVSVRDFLAVNMYFCLSYLTSD